MVSVFLVSMLTILILNLYPSSVMATRQAEQAQRADRIAQSVLSQAMSRPFASLALGLNETFPDETRGGIVYRSTLEVLPLPAGSDPELARALKVTVNWEDRGKQRQVVHEVWVPKIPRYAAHSTNLAATTPQPCPNHRTQPPGRLDSHRSPSIG